MARETQMGACLLQKESFSASASGVPSGCVEQAHSLVGFSCENQNSNFYCLKPTIFSGSDNYCMTISAAAGMGNKVDFGHRLNKGSSLLTRAPVWPMGDCGPVPVCLFSGSCSTCCQFCCSLAPEHWDLVQGPDSYSSRRKVQPCPDSLIPHPLVLSPHHQACPALRRSQLPSLPGSVM